MKTAKKSLTYISLVFLLACIALLIGSIFGLKVFSGTLFKILETCAVLALASAFALNSIAMINKNRIIAFVSLGLISLLSVLCLIIFWVNIKSGTFANIVFVVAITTILFNIIVSTALKLDKRYLVIQIITYILITAVDVVLSLQIFGVDVFGVKGFWQSFTVACLVVFGLLCTLGILEKKNVSGIKEKEIEGTMTISKEEYNKLIIQIKQLEEENKTLKEKIK